MKQVSPSRPLCIQQNCLSLETDQSGCLLLIINAAATSPNLSVDSTSKLSMLMLEVGAGAVEKSADDKSPVSLKDKANKMPENAKTPSDGQQVAKNGDEPT